MIFIKPWEGLKVYVIKKIQKEASSLCEIHSEIESSRKEQNIVLRLGESMIEIRFSILLGLRLETYLAK